ncbi:hypothetical protein ACB092_03G097200 [Castanea dentata]
MDYYYHILVTWALPLMIFLINLRSYPIRLVLLHPHHLNSIEVICLIIRHILNQSHHHHVHPPTTCSNVVELFQNSSSIQRILSSSTPTRSRQPCHHQFITVSINMIVPTSFT